MDAQVMQAHNGRTPRLYFFRCTSLWTDPAQVRACPQPACRRKSCPCSGDTTEAPLPTVVNGMQVLDAKGENGGYQQRGRAFTYYC